MQKGREELVIKKIKVWFDPEGDYLEVLFNDKAGFMRETDHDAVMERVDQKGNLLGFSIMQVSHFRKKKPLGAHLA